jgi:hypothetical protein
MTPADTLAPWHDFCLLSGTASATFVALLFVAASVGSGIWERPEALRVFLTATVVHFSSVLLVNLIVVAPLHSELISGLLIGSAALVGMLYCGLILRDLVQHGLGARIGWEDRLWYAALPVMGYLVMALSGILVASHVRLGSTTLAMAILLLLVAGIRNAWDITIWIVTRRRG